MSGRPDEDIDGIRTAQASFLAAVVGLDDEVGRQPSRLPGWTIAHVVAHVAANGDSVTRRLLGCIAGEVVDQYPGGLQGREREIEELSALPLSRLIGKVRDSNDEVLQTIARMPDDAWDRESRGVGGELRPAHAVVWSRWRECVVHQTDLGLGHSSADWPPALVARWLPDALAGLSDRAEPSALLGWAVGRGEPPQLQPWG
jgi:maleylpyruvate isomerase